MKTKNRLESENQSGESGNQNVPKNLNNETNMNYLGILKHKKPWTHSKTITRGTNQTWK